MSFNTQEDYEKYIKYQQMQEQLLLQEMQAQE
jgi:hypothetical protein